MRDLWFILISFLADARSWLMADMKSAANVGPKLLKHVPAYAGCQSCGAALPGFRGAVLARGLPCVGNKSGTVKTDKSRNSGHMAATRCARNEDADHSVFRATPKASLVRGLKARVLAVNGGDAESNRPGNKASAVG